MYNINTLKNSFSPIAISWRVSALLWISISKSLKIFYLKVNCCYLRLLQDWLLFDGKIFFRFVLAVMQCQDDFCHARHNIHCHGIVTWPEIVIKLSFVMTYSLVKLKPYFMLKWFIFCHNEFVRWHELPFNHTLSWHCHKIFL